MHIPKRIKFVKVFTYAIFASFDNPCQIVQCTFILLLGKGEDTQCSPHSTTGVYGRMFNKSLVYKVYIWDGFVRIYKIV